MTFSRWLEYIILHRRAHENGPNVRHRSPPPPPATLFWVDLQCDGLGGTQGLELTFSSTTPKVIFFGQFRIYVT